MHTRWPNSDAHDIYLSGLQYWIVTTDSGSRGGVIFDPEAAKNTSPRGPTVIHDLILLYYLTVSC